MKGCDAEGKDRAEHENHGNGRFSGSRVFGLFEQATGGSHANPNDCATAHGSYHKLASTEAIDECGSNEGKDELEAGVAEVDIRLLNGLVVAGGVKNGGDKVAQYSTVMEVSRVLARSKKTGWYAIHHIAMRQSGRRRHGIRYLYHERDLLASPLTKTREGTVACESVARAAVLEEGGVIPVSTKNGIISIFHT